MVAAEKHKVYIKKSVWEEIIKYCQQQRPIEACGLVGGKGNDINTLFPLENIEKSKYAYAISEKDFTSTLKEMEKQGVEFVGVFHSHPTSSAYPSKDDMKHAYSPELVYLILSLKNNTPILKAYYLKRFKVERIRIELY